MKTILFKRLFPTLLMIVSLCSANLWAEEPLTTDQQAQLNAIQKMLKENPVILNDLKQSLTLFTQQQQRFENVLKDNQDYLQNNPDHVQSGASNPELVIVNFTDFNCPWCKKLDAELAKLVAAYPEIKLVNIFVPLKEMFGSATGVNSSEYALNVWASNKNLYSSVHKLLMKKPGNHNQASLTQIAQATGTTEQLKEAEKAHQLIQKNIDILQQLGLQGTPALLINGKILPGFVPFKALEKIVTAELKA